MHSRSRHRHSRRRPFLAEYGFALLVSLLALAATIPRGSVGFFESRLVAIGAWLVGGLGWLTAAPRPPVRSMPRRLAGVAALLLALWCGWQLYPGSGAWHGRFWRGDAKLFADLMDDASAGSLAVERFVSFHTAWLWAGLGVLAWAAARRIRHRRALKAAVIGLVAVGLVQAVLGIVLGVDADGRLLGTFGSPNALGGLLAMTLPLHLGLLLAYASRRPLRGRTSWRWWLQRLGDSWEAWRRPLLWFTWIVQWAALYLTGSMGGAIAALAACAVLTVWMAKDHPEFRLPLVAWSAALVIAAAAFGLHARHQNVLDRASGETAAWETSAASRLEIWRAAWALCRDFPLGTGPGGTSRILAIHQPESMGRYRLDFAHKDLFQFRGDLGRPGFWILAFLLGLTLWQGGKACRPSEFDDAGSVWFRRGAWVSVLAALIHAQTEFNLSARPGVQIVFALLCGLLWIRTDFPPAGDAPAGGSGRMRRRVGRGLMAAAGLAALWFSGTAARAWPLREGVCAAQGLSGDPYFWFSKPSLTPENVDGALARAKRLAPGSAEVRRTAAESVLVRHDRLVDRVARDLLAAENVEVAPDLPLDLVDPVHERALQNAARATRVEEAAALDLALAEAERAVALAPWDSASRLLRAEVRLRMAAGPGLRPDAQDRGRRDLLTATALYPADASVLAKACAILSNGPRSAGDREPLLEWGSRALRLDPSRAWTVFDAWWRRHIGVEKMLASVELPVEILWNLYARLDRARRDDDARLCLAALEQRISAGRMPPASAWWAPLRKKQWEIQQAQYRIRIATEWLKRHLREGAWDQIRNSREARAEMRALRFQVELDKMELSGSASPALRRLRLREWADAGRLAPVWIYEWILAESEAGAPLGAVDEAVAELVLLDADPPRRARLSQVRFAGAKYARANVLLEALRAEQSGRLDQADEILERALASRDVAPAAVHRVWLWQARLREEAGRLSDADAARQAAAAACPSDPDAAASPTNQERQGAAAFPLPVPVLDLGFAGQRLRLLQVAMEPAAEAAAESRLHLAWRFCGTLPADLRFDVRIRDEDGHARMRKSVLVDREPGAGFHRGQPLLGSTWIWSLPVSAFAAKGTRLDVWATANRARLPADDGLAALEFDLEKLPQVRTPATP